MARIQFGDNFDIRETTDGDYVVEHLPSGTKYRFDENGLAAPKVKAGELSGTHTYSWEFDSVQEAVDSGTGHTVLPPGTQEVNNPVTVSDGQIVEGSGKGTALVPTNDADMFTGEDLDGVTIRDLYVHDRDGITSGESAAISIKSWREPRIENITVENYSIGYRIYTTVASNHTRYGHFDNLTSLFCRTADMEISDSVQDNSFTDLTFWSDPGVGSGGGLTMDRTLGPVTGQHGGNRFLNLSIVGAPDFGLEIVNYDQVWFGNVIVDGSNNAAGILIKPVGLSPKQIIMDRVWSNVNGAQGMKVVGDSLTTPVKKLQVSNFSFGSNATEGMKLANVTDSKFTNGIIHKNNGNGIRFQNSVEDCTFDVITFESNVDSAINHNSYGADNDYTNIRLGENPLNVGTRSSVNGYSENEGSPKTTGDWNGFAAEAYERGTLVWDTTTSPWSAWRADGAGNWTGT